MISRRLIPPTETLKVYDLGMTNNSQPPLSPILRSLVILTGTYAVGFVGLQGMILGIQFRGIPPDLPLWAPNPTFLSILVMIQCGLIGWAVIRDSKWKSTWPLWAFIILCSAWFWVAFQVSVKATAWPLGFIAINGIFMLFLAIRKSDHRIVNCAGGFYSLAFSIIGFALMKAQ